MNLLPLLLNRYVAGGIIAALIMAALFWAGDTYGLNARRYAKCQTETARRNAAIKRVNEEETLRHAQEEERRMHQSQAFSQCEGVQQCILTEATDKCLRLLD